MRKIQCQLAISISTPPSTGPTAEDTSATTAISASPKPRCCGGNTSTVIAKPSGARMPAPTPWITRKTISHSIDHAAAHSAEPIVKTVRPRTKKLAPPELVGEPPHRDEQHREDDVVGVDDPGDRSPRRWTSRPAAPGSRCSRSRRPAGPSPSRSSSRRRSATCARRGTRRTGCWRSTARLALRLRLTAGGSSPPSGMRPSHCRSCLRDVVVGLVVVERVEVVRDAVVVRVVVAALARRAQRAVRPELGQRPAAPRSRRPPTARSACRCPRWRCCRSA